MASEDLPSADPACGERPEGSDTQPPLSGLRKAAGGGMDVVSLTVRKYPHRLSMPHQWDF